MAHTRTHSHIAYLHRYNRHNSNSSYLFDICVHQIISDSVVVDVYLHPAPIYSLTSLYRTRSDLDP